MDNELIQLFFDPETENIDWEKRSPCINSVKKNNVNQVNNTVKNNPVKQYKQITENFKKYIEEVNKRIDDYSVSTAKGLKNKLVQDYKILCVNFDRYGQFPEMLNCIKKLDRCLHNNHISNNYKMTKTKQQPALASMEVKIQNRLKEIKSLIKKDLDSSKIIKLKNELTSLRAKLINYTDTFSEICNIPSKITQIDSYLSKIGQVPSAELFTNTNSNETQVDDKCESKTSGQTQRGIEIQEELATLREETKRKDLNPIEKENLTNTLIKLQNEITSSMEKFSKFDSIPVRLNQIENYLEKLKKKEEIKTTEIIQKIDVEEKKDDGSKKKKMQVIWKFSL